jgi:hypothetical protein
MGDTSRYIGPYVLAKKGEDWEDKYAYGDTDGLGLKKMRCFSYGAIPLFVPDYARDEDSFEDFGKEVDGDGGTVVFDVDEEMIKRDISKMTKECNADLKRLKKTFGSLSIKWGMVTQYG